MADLPRTAELARVREARRMEKRGKTVEARHLAGLIDKDVPRWMT